MVMLDFSKTVKNSDSVLKLYMLLFDIAYLMLHRDKGLIILSLYFIYIS